MFYRMRNIINCKKNGWTQGKMKTMMHHHAIKNLTKKIGNSPLSGILIDQFCQPNVFKKHLATENEQLTMDTFFYDESRKLFNCGSCCIHYCPDKISN